MDRHAVKEKLIRIFAETHYLSANITPEFREKYIESMWRGLFSSCEVAIKTGTKTITIDEFCVNALDLKFPAHERENVFLVMKDTIKASLDDALIPYTIEIPSYNPNKVKFRINVNTLKEFSDYEKLGQLL